jgi:phosphate:Na+ symporter
MTLSSIGWDRILGGFGLFMFGIQFMGNGLKASAGDRMRVYIDRYTSKTWSAMLVGILLTILMQSSSASTAITIGFVRAGLMTLEQAAGIVLGANIGSTVTSLLISLNIDQYSLYIVFAGCMLCCFGKRRKTQYMGQVVLGFGLIFFGLSSMGDAMASLKDLPQFSSFALKMSDNAWLSLGTGTLMTMVVQSSAATIGVIQKLYDAGALTLSASLPFMFGADIGTTITGVLAAMGGSLGARRTAALHTVFNIIAGFCGMLLLQPYTRLIMLISERASLTPMMEIAVANILFKTAAALVFMPFLKQLTALVCRIVPGQEPSRPQVDIDNLDDSMAAVMPQAAIAEAEKAMDQMASLVMTNIRGTQDFLKNKGTTDDKQVLDQTESLINNCDQKITDFLVHVSIRSSIPPADKERMRIDLDVIKNMERLGDLAVNLAEFYQMVEEDNGYFTEKAGREIDAMYSLLYDMLNKSLEVYHYRNPQDMTLLMVYEDRMDLAEEKARENHFERMERGECSSPVAGAVYVDILSTLERMGDHCVNIGRTSLSAGRKNVQ